ncbi:hypothetical protein [Bacteroides acidifaciens]|nr:hypothetical protein [Bacteroides acidifaciens]
MRLFWLSYEHSYQYETSDSERKAYETTEWIWNRLQAIWKAF